MSCFLNMVTSSDVIVPRREEQQHQHHHHQYYNGGEYGGAMMTTSVAPRIRVEIANGIRKGEKFITELSGCERVRDFVSMKLCKNEYLRGKEVKVYLDEYELLGDTSVDVLGHEDKIFVVVCDDEGDEMEEEEEVDDGFARVRAELEKREEEKKKEKKKKKKKKTTLNMKKETNNRGTRIVNQQHERKQKKHNLEHSLRMAPTMVTMKKVQKKMATVPSKKDERPRLGAQVVYASSSEEDDDDGDSHGLEELSSSSDEDGGDRAYFVRNVGVQKISRSLKKNGTPNSKEKIAESPKKKKWQSRLLRNAEKPDWMCRGAGSKWSCTEKKAPGKPVCEKHSRMPKRSKPPVAPPPPPAKKAGKTLEKLENARKAAASSALTCEKCGKVCKGQGPLTMHVRSCKGSDSSIAASPAADETKKGGQPPLLRGKRVPIKLLRKCARSGGVKSILAELVVNYRIGARSNVPVTAMVPAHTPVATAPILAPNADADKNLIDVMVIAKKKAEDTKKRLEHELRVEGEKLEKAREKLEKAKKEELEERKRLEALKSKAEIERLEAARKMEEEKEKRKAEEERRVAAEAEAKRVERARVEEALKMKAEQEKKAAAEREKVEAARQKQIEEARLEAARKMEEEVRLQAAKKKMAEEEEKRRQEEHEKLEKEKKVNDEARRGRSKDATVERQEKEVEEVTPLKSSIVLKPGEVACGAPTNKQVMCPYPAKTCPWHIHGDGDDKDDQVHHNRRHLLTSGDIGPSLKGKWISVLWPDTGEWFDGEILNMNNSTAKLWYPADDIDDATLGEREDINLEEAIEGNEISWPLVARKPLTLQAKLVDETSSLDILRDYITSCGGKLEGNWSVQVKVRQSGQSALTGHVDHYFFSPEGKKYRSKVEVARALNVPKLPKSAKKRKVVYNKDDDIGTPPPKNRKETHSQRLSDKTAAAAAAAVAAATTAAAPYVYGSPEASPDYFLQRSFDGENETNLSDSFLTNTTNINTIITDAITNVDEKIHQQQGEEYNNRNTTDRDDNASSPLPPLFKNKSGERMELTVHQNDGWM